jgi:alkylhydroperoxidase family enzyme
MARLPYADLTNASEEVKTMAAQLPPLNIFRMLPHAPTLLRGFGQLGSSILGRMKLDARLRELVILRVGARSPAAYEWQQHVPIARACGATDAEIAALERADLDATSLDDRARVLLAFTDELLAAPRASDAALAAMRRTFSDQEVCEAIFTVGFYMMVARFLETTGVDLEPGDTTAAAAMVARLQDR